MNSPPAGVFSGPSEEGSAPVGSVPVPAPAPAPLGTIDDFVDGLNLGRLAKHTLVERNLRLVFTIANKYSSSSGVHRMDLIQEGSLGLMRAADRFDPTRGFKFGTYASWWIQQSIFLAIARQSRVIRLPVHIHAIVNRSRKAKAKFLATHGRTPTDKEVAELLGMTEEKYQKIVRLTREATSLDARQFHEQTKLGDSARTYGDMVSEENGWDGSGGGGDGGMSSMSSSSSLSASSSSSPLAASPSSPSSSSSSSSSDPLLDDSSPHEQLDRQLFKSDILRMLDDLDPAEGTVLRLRYGLDDGKFRTITQVAKILGRDNSYVRSKEDRAIRKLRRPFYEKTLRDHQESLYEQ